MTVWLLSLLRLLRRRLSVCEFENQISKSAQLTDFDGDRGDEGVETERSLSLNVPISAPALGGASPFDDLAEEGVSGRAGVDGVEGTDVAS